MWFIVAQAAAAIYLVLGPLMINASPNIESRIAFKVIPMSIGIPLAFGVVAQWMGWPV